MGDPDLTGRSILIVEDEHLVAKSLARLLDLWGATIIGPVATVDNALAVVRSTEQLDFAIIDINLRGVTCFSVTDALIALRVPFAFTTGYENAAIPESYGTVAVLQKPYDPDRLAKVLSPLTN